MEELVIEEDLLIVERVERLEVLCELVGPVEEVDWIVVWVWLMVDEVELELESTRKPATAIMTIRITTTMITTIRPTALRICNVVGAEHCSVFKTS
jgi:hypothetical protein